jgi:hypothetical protein
VGDGRRGLPRSRSERRPFPTPPTPRAPTPGASWPHLLASRPGDGRDARPGMRLQCASECARALEERAAGRARRSGADAGIAALRGVREEPVEAAGPRRVIILRPAAPCHGGGEIEG